jgi:hypothetical protein
MMNGDKKKWQLDAAAATSVAGPRPTDRETDTEPGCGAESTRRIDFCHIMLR